MSVRALAAVAGIMLLLALLPLNSDYYAGLRWVVTIVSLLVIWDGWRASPTNSDRRRWWVYLAAPVLAAVAVFFNPVYPVWMERGDWRPLNFFAGLVFLQYPFISFASWKEVEENKVWIGVRAFGVFCLIAAAITAYVLVSEADPTMEDSGYDCVSPYPGEC